MKILALHNTLKHKKHGVVSDVALEYVTLSAGPKGSRNHVFIEETED